MAITNFPSPLVETDWLATHLEEPELRILDCTVFLHPLELGGYRAESGHTAWLKGHIPGSGFADLIKDLSDSTSHLRFMMPSAEHFAREMGRLGVSNESYVVLYDQAQNIWAARLWWMLRVFGFNQAAVLNGGWKKWTLEGRPTTTEITSFTPAIFEAKPRPELIASKEDVLAALEKKDTCLVNALPPDQFEGQVNIYGRPGRIPSSVNIPAASLIDPKTHAYRPIEQLRAEINTKNGVEHADKTITYCGAGIAASSDALILHLLGKKNVAVYDGSMSEWAADPNLPMETGKV